MNTIWEQQTTKSKQSPDLSTHDLTVCKYIVASALPYIIQSSSYYKVSSETVFKAFIDLKERGIIDSTRGKGYFVVNAQKKILFLLDEYSLF